MADDAEILDWGGEDDEHLGHSQGHNRSATAGDVDDVVSIGGEEDDMQELAAFHSRTMRDDEKEKTPPARVKPPEVESGKKSPQRDSGAAEAPPTSSAEGALKTEVPLARKSSRRRSRSPPRSVKVPPLTHALPPKPVVAAVPSTRSTSFMEASSMTNSRRSQEVESSRRTANGSKPVFSDTLPPDWETRHSSAGEPYYYNIRTHVSQWDRPTLNGKAASPNPTAYDRDVFSDRRGENKLDRTKSSGGLRSDRMPEPQIYKGMERSRPASPVQELSYDDRHYRPSNGVDIPSRDLQRDQRDPLSSNQPSFREDVLKESLSVQGKVRSERDVSRPFGQRSDVDEGWPRRRPSEPREVPPVSRNVVKEEGRLVPRLQRPDRERGRALRHDEGAAKDVRSSQQGFADDRQGGTLYSANDFREPPPRSGNVAPSSTHRRYRSRSASPQLRGSTSSRGERNETVPKYDDTISRRDFHPGNPASGPSLSANAAEQHSRWNSSISGHRDGGRPLDLGPPARRPREQDPASRNDMGSDSKRRRIDRVTTDGMDTPRGRPSSIMDMRGDFYRPDPYAADMKTRTDRRGNNNDGMRSSGVVPSFGSARQDDYSFAERSGHTDFIEKSGDPGFNGGSASKGSLPAGPRGRPTDQRDVEVESRGSYTDDRWPTPAEHQQEDRQSKHDGRDLRGRRSGVDRVPHDNRAPSTLEPVDVGDARPRTYDVSSKASDFHSDRDERQEGIDRLPTGPRAMHSKDTPSSSSSHLTSPGVHRVVTPPETPRYDGRRSSTVELRGRRSTRFDEPVDSQRYPIDRSKNDLQDEPLRGSDTGNERLDPIIRSSLEPGRRSEVLHPGDWLPSERLDVPNGPRFYIRQHNNRRPTSPKLTGANNVPVPARKNWTVDSNVAAIPVSFDGGQSARSDERRRWPLENDRSVEPGRRVVSPKSTYENLHGDVEHKMSLSDGNETTDNNRFPIRGQERELGESVKQRGNLPPTASQSTRVSRFSTQTDVRPSDIGANDEPRIWLPRDATERLRATGRDEGRVPNLPRSTGANRSNAGSSMHKLSPNEHTFGVDSPRDSSAKEFKDSRQDTTSPTSGKSPRLRSTSGLREEYDGSRRSAHSHDAPYQRQNLVNARGSSELDPQSTRHSDIKAGRLANAFQETSVQSGQELYNANHTSRSLKLAPAGGQSESYRQAGRRNNSPSDEPSLSQTPALLTRRPNMKPEYEPRQSVPSEPGRSEVHQVDDQAGHDIYDRPSQLRSNSLLDRLSMNAEATNSGASEGSHPALRDRIGHSRRFGNSDPGWDNVARSPKDSPRREDNNVDHAEGYKSRSHGRGRGRNSRNRRRTRHEPSSQKEKLVPL